MSAMHLVAFVLSVRSGVYQVADMGGLYDNNLLKALRPRFH
ncbi:hypothetical protein PC128_g21534 [Phytophthora cactorum]|nr:hypothetical protein PC120_g13344 [Phytophthora cactorum]KAG3068318.1 hypothetical protein PC121_g10238 [Phytophthora cactorum]KAG3158255.1 hypothetical protein PC128_g21534 [Phytophthora cactorum]KAG4050515.1 hypothetical protein PC123_g14246 [Phytophthora cactorum]